MTTEVWVTCNIPCTLVGTPAPREVFSRAGITGICLCSCLLLSHFYLVLYQVYLICLHILPGFRIVRANSVIDF